MPEQLFSILQPLHTARKRWLHLTPCAILTTLLLSATLAAQEEQPVLTIDTRGHAATIRDIAFTEFKSRSRRRIAPITVKTAPEPKVEWLAPADFTTTVTE